MAEHFVHGYALLIGVGETRHSPWSLPVTVRDARALRSILVDPTLCAYADDEKHVRLLHDDGATRQAILDGLDWLAGRAAADPQATALVYYSGHGCQERSTGAYYLVTHDVRPYDIAGSILPATTFGQGIGHVKAQRLLVVMDCCHAEAMAGAKGGPADGLPPELEPAAVPDGLVAVLKRGQGRAVFTSCRSGQQSWTRPDEAASIYTYHLLEALQGAGSRPGETAVCLSNLMGYLSRAVPASARALRHAEQTPFFDTAAEDFPVAVLRGGKGLPGGGWPAARPEAETILRNVYQVTVTGSGAAAQGSGAQAAGERGVAARDIAGPVVTGDGSTGAGRDVILAPGGSRVQIGGDIRAGQIRARNVVSGVQMVGAPHELGLRNLRREVTALREQLARAVAAGEMVDPTDAEDARQALATAEEELAGPQPRGNRVVRRLAEAADILDRGAEAAESLGQVGSPIIKLAPIAATIYQSAQKLFGG